MTRKARITEARSGKVVVESNFAGYDYCCNPYVGCQFGCNYCYVRFFQKDTSAKKLPWGQWVRVRSHAPERIVRDLLAIGPTRLVFGTMTDPYQPAEATQRIMQGCLNRLIFHAQELQLEKVGIFTRSPLVLRDKERIRMLPKARVHVTIPPLPPEVQIPTHMKVEAHLGIVAKLKAAGIRTHVSVAPAMPLLSEEFTAPLAEKLADVQVDEFFVDPVQPYRQSMEELSATLKGNRRWLEVAAIMLDRERYAEWKAAYSQQWRQEWEKNAKRSPNTLPIMADHEAHVKRHMLTGELLDWETYDRKYG